MAFTSLATSTQLACSATLLFRYTAFGSGQVSLKTSRAHRLKQLMVRCGVGAALLATCLQAGAASALSFNFSFTGTGNPTSPATVTGIVDGLVDNLNDQKYGLLITITSATNTPSGGWTVFTNYAGGEGFDVSGGQVTGVDIWLIENNRPQKLYLGNQDYHNPLLVTPFPIEMYNADGNNTTSNSLMFTPASSVSVPGPLPLFGAAAAFGWSRQLKRRIQTPA